MITGDIFRHKDPQPIEFDAFSAGIRKLMDENIQTYIILGNHDIFLSHKLKNSISALKTLGLKKVHISEEPELIYFKIREENMCIQTMPYQNMSLLGMKSHEEVSEYMVNKINNMYDTIKTNHHILFAGHFSISDSVAGSEQQTINKFNEPIIPKSVFKGKKYLYGAMGHLHSYQVVLRNPLIIYGGSINRTDFNEWKEDKGFVHCKYDNKFEHEFIKVDAQRFVDLEYNLEEHNNPEGFILQDLMNKQNQIDGAVVRIMVNLSEGNKHNYSAKNVADFLNEHCNFIQGSTSPHISKSELTEGGEYNEYMNAIDVMKKYCESSSRVVNKDLFMKLAEEIIKESNNTK